MAVFAPVSSRNTRSSGLIPANFRGHRRRGPAQGVLVGGEFEGGAAGVRLGGQGTGQAEALLEAADEGGGDGEPLGHLGGAFARLAGLVDAQAQISADGSHSSWSSLYLHSTPSLHPIELRSSVR